jgi:hypothetical protein
MNAAGNELWLTTYYLSVQSGGKLDPTNFEMTMKSVNNFIAAYKAMSNPDAYLTSVYNLLTKTYAGTSSCSLASLASNFATNGYSGADFTNYKLMFLDSTSPLSELESSNADGINAFGGNEGMYNSNPQYVSKAAIQNLMADLNAQPPVPANIIADVKKLTTELGLNGSSPDGLSQFMTDLINIPLDPTNAAPGLASATLLSLSESPTGAADLQSIMSGSSWTSILGDVNNLGNEIMGFENWG